MSDLSSIERLKFEALFDMESGYVLDFSNNTFSVFTIENVGIDIFDSKYEYGSNSKANRLRKFWLEESNEVVGKLLSALLDYWVTKKKISEAELSSKEETLYDECKKIVIRLSQDSFRQIQENTSSLLQKGRIFISYRRTDSAGYAGRIYDRLVARFGENAIFMDVDTIEGGVDFIKVLEDAVQSCDVLIALIGRQWLSITDKDGKRRLDSPEDFVRIEIATALKRNIRVIPVLVDGVDMPQPIELPENLKALARRNALQVNHHSFNPDVYRLIEHLEAALDEAEKLRVMMKAQALQAALEKVRLEAEEKARQIAAKEKTEREAAEKAAREKAHQEATEKARLEAEELVRQKAAKEKAEREVAEKAAQEKVEKETQREVRKIINKNKREIRWEYFKLRIRNWLAKARIYGVPTTLFLIGIAFVVYMFISYSKDIPVLNRLLNPIPQPSQISTQIFSPTTTLTSLPPTLTFTPASPTKTEIPTIVPTETSLQEEIVDEKGITMRLVQAGTFTMGTDKKPEYSWVIYTPAYEAYLDSYYMDIYEVTNEAYKLCVADGVCELPNDTSTKYNKSRYANHPIVFVDRGKARIYCTWRGARLPTEAEWEKAARGTDGRTYPWGEGEPDCGKANFGGLQGCIGDTTPVGSYGSGKSPYGIYDMEGNVSEWLEDGYRGGSWNTVSIYYHSGDSRENSIGFRCARDANP